MGHQPTDAQMPERAVLVAEGAAAGAGAGTGVNKQNMLQQRTKT